jgi:hypothetical protein
MIVSGAHVAGDRGGVDAEPARALDHDRVPGAQPRALSP